MNRRVLIRDLNPGLVCVLCGGYFVDATTIVECVHSFCRACIVKHFESSKYCPICEVMVHKTKPLLSLKRDKTLQDIVYKLVPDLFAREMSQRRQFYQERPHYVKPDDVESGGEVSDERRSYICDDSISLRLKYVGADCSPWYLRCPLGVTIRHLKKLINCKYGFDEDKVVPEILLMDQILDDDLSLLDIACLFPYRSKDVLEFSFALLEVKNKLSDQRDKCPEKIDTNLSGKDPIEKEVQLQITEAGVMSISEIDFSDVIRTPHDDVIQRLVAPPAPSLSTPPQNTVVPSQISTKISEKCETVTSFPSPLNIPRPIVSTGLKDVRKRRASADTSAPKPKRPSISNEIASTNPVKNLESSGTGNSAEKTISKSSSKSCVESKISQGSKNSENTDAVSTVLQGSKNSNNFSAESISESSKSSRKSSGESNVPESLKISRKSLGESNVPESLKTSRKLSGEVNNPESLKNSRKSSGEINLPQGSKNSKNSANELSSSLSSKSSNNSSGEVNPTQSSRISNNSSELHSSQGPKNSKKELNILHTEKLLSQPSSSKANAHTSPVSKLANAPPPSTLYLVPSLGIEPVNSKESGEVKTAGENHFLSQKTKQTEAPSQKPAKHKAIRSTPEPWRPVITKEKLRPTLMSNSDEPKKPGKFFKMRNMPRFLGNPAVGVKPMYSNGLPQPIQSSPPKKCDQIIRMDPKTLRPIQKEEKKSPNVMMTNPFIPNHHKVVLPDPKTYSHIPPGFHASLPPSISLLLNPLQHFRNLKAKEAAAAASKTCDSPIPGPSASVAPEGGKVKGGECEAPPHHDPSPSTANCT